MDMNEVKELHRGDQVFWTDPDKGLCSRYIIIKRVEIDEPNEIISIYDHKNDYLQCFAQELS